MPAIAGELQSSTEDATECPELTSFSCGDGRKASTEGAVERIVAGHRAGKIQDAVFRVTREYPPGSFVGLAAIEWPGLVARHPSFNAAAFSDAAYIAVLSLNEPYRGRFRTSEGEPLSHALMRDALEFIESRSSGGPIPPVQAIIDPTNTASRTLAEEFGFVQPIETSPDLWYLRPRGLPVPPSTETDGTEDEEDAEA